MLKFTLDRMIYCSSEVDFGAFPKTDFSGIKSPAVFVSHTKGQRIRSEANAVVTHNTEKKIVFIFLIKLWKSPHRMLVTKIMYATIGRMIEIRTFDDDSKKRAQ